MKNFEKTVPVDVFVYKGGRDTWCSLTQEFDMDEYLIQTIKAVPTAKPIHLTDDTDEIEVGDVFVLNKAPYGKMERVEQIISEI